MKNVTSSFNTTQDSGQRAVRLDKLRIAAKKDEEPVDAILKRMPTNQMLHIFLQLCCCVEKTKTIHKCEVLFFSKCKNHKNHQFYTQDLIVMQAGALHRQAVVNVHQCWQSLQVTNGVVREVLCRCWCIFTQIVCMSWKYSFDMF